MTDTKLPVKIEKNIKLCSDITKWARDFGLDDLDDDDCMSVGEAYEMLEQGVEYFDAIARAELPLELLQVFNDYDVPLTMTAEQVRDILEAYLTKKE